MSLGNQDITTIKNINEIFKDISNRHYQINTYGWGRDADVGDTEVKYPLLWVKPIDATMIRSESNDRYTSIEVTFNIKALDKTSKGKEDEVDIVSDTYQMLTDVINEFNDHPYYQYKNMRLAGDINFSELTEFSNDQTDGWECDVSVRLRNITSWCGIPAQAITGYNNVTPQGFTATTISQTDYYTTGATLNGYTAFFDRNDTLSAYTLDLSSLSGAPDTNTFTTGGTLLNNTLFFDRNDLLSAFTIDVSALSGGSSASLWSASTGTNSIIANNGTGNIASGDYSIVAGGVGGFTSGQKSFVGGGGYNSASTYYATVVGGNANLASGTASFIGGGGSNRAIGNYSTAFGSSNQATGYYSAIIGGSNGRATGAYSFVAGGDEISATTTYATAINGKDNLASGIGATVIGGNNNLASGAESLAGGGTYNNAEGEKSVVLGGGGFSKGVSLGNTATTNSDSSAIIGGKENKIDIAYSFIGGGNGNEINNDGIGDSSAIIGGQNNVVSGLTGFIGGGNGNYVQDRASGIIAGVSGEVNGRNSFIGGGQNNIVTSNSLDSAIIGGSGNTLDALYSVVIGGQGINGTTDNTVYVPYMNIGSLSATTTATTQTDLVIDSSGNVLKNSLFYIGINFETTGVTWNYVAPEVFQINSVDNPDSISYTLLHNGTGYTFGNNISLYDDISVTGVTTTGFLKLNSELI